LGEITAREILEVLLAVRRQGIEETARRCRQYLSQIFQHAIVRGWADRNPAADLQGIPELRKIGPTRHQRAVKTPAELGRLLRDIESISDTLAGKALGLAPYVFVRAGELAGARWAEVDLASSLWRIPAERMKMKGEHLVPLARQVKDRIEALHELTGGGPCLFPALSGGQAPMNPESLRRALDRLGYGPGALVSHTTHGFKSCASTFLREQGFNPAWIEIQLAHGERNKVVAAYNHADYIPQRQEMMQRWADYLDELKQNCQHPTTLGISDSV
jgi:integrase